MCRQENEAVLLQKLNTLTDAWKTMQVSLGYNPDIPLQWSVEDSILFLYGVWICPAQFISLEKLSNHDPSVDEICISIALQDGYVDIIIVKEHEGYMILTIERHVPRSTAY